MSNKTKRVIMYALGLFLGNIITTLMHGGIATLSGVPISSHLILLLLCVITANLFILLDDAFIKADNKLKSRVKKK